MAPYTDFRLFRPLALAISYRIASLEQVVFATGNLSA
jgi:hypothetical protein